jgi:LCP family protein required for cell wall assembly
MTPAARPEQRRAGGGASVWSHPWTVAVASFLWPGLGHLLLRRTWIALALAAPQLLLAGLAIAAVLADRASVAGWLVTPSVLMGLIALDLLVLGSRVVAVVDGPRRALKRRTPSLPLLATTIALAVALIGVSVAGHGRAAELGLSAYDTLITVFSPAGPRGQAFGALPTPTPPATGTASPSTAVASLPPSVESTPAPTLVSPSSTPRPMPAWQADGRLNLLLVGSDAGPGRWQLRTDTMIVLSVNLEDGSAALIGVPRNLQNVPLPPPLDASFPDGYPDLLNSLWLWVQAHPGSYPGDATIAPFHALRDAVGSLLGLQVDGMAVVELQGFVRAVDALGGVVVDVPAPVYDARYPDPDGTGNVVLSVPVGSQWMDGWHALAYARSRHQDSDYGRMERQQTVLLALEDQLRCQLTNHIGDLLLVARDTMWVDLPLGDLPEMIRLGERVDPASVVRITLTPPRYPVVLDANSAASIRAAVADLLASAPPPPAPGDGEGQSPCPEPATPSAAS